MDFGCWKLKLLTFYQIKNVKENLTKIKKKATEIFLRGKNKFPPSPNHFKVCFGVWFVSFLKRFIFKIWGTCPDWWAGFFSHLLQCKVGMTSLKSDLHWCKRGELGLMCTGDSIILNGCYTCHMGTISSTNRYKTRESQFLPWFPLAPAEGKFQQPFTGYMFLPPLHQLTLLASILGVKTKVPFAPHLLSTYSLPRAGGVETPWSLLSSLHSD